MDNTVLTALITGLVSAAIVAVFDYIVKYRFEQNRVKLAIKEKISEAKEAYFSSFAKFVHYETEAYRMLGKKICQNPDRSQVDFWKERSKIVDKHSIDRSANRDKLLGLLSLYIRSDDTLKKLRKTVEFTEFENIINTLFKVTSTKEFIDYCKDNLDKCKVIEDDIRAKRNECMKIRKKKNAKFDKKLRKAKLSLS